MVRNHTWAIQNWVNSMPSNFPSTVLSLQPPDLYLLYKPNQFSISVLYELRELGAHFHSKSPKGPQGNSLLVNTDHPPPNDSGVLVVLGFLFF